MTNSGNRIYLFIHLILEVQGSKALLNPTLRAVYVAWIKKHMAERGIRIHHAAGGLEHMHFLLQLHPAQNLLQVVRQLREESQHFINDSHFLQEDFQWEQEYTAFSVSPGNVGQTMDYFNKQDEWHATRSFAQEMDLIHQTRINLHES